MISIAELKFPVFQQVWATRNRHERRAWRSSIVEPLVIVLVTHKRTYDKKKAGKLLFE